MSRIYFPIHAVALARDGQGVASGDIPGQRYYFIHGLQSAGITTTFNLEQFFEIGQSELYANLEARPDIELSLEKIQDGYPLIQHLASRNATSATLLGRYNGAKCNAVVSYYPLTNDAASGVPLKHMYMSGLYISNINMSYPLEGAQRETVTLVGNHKINLGSMNYWVPTGSTTSNSGTDSPNSTGIMLRQYVDMGKSLWPTEIPGIDASGWNTSGSVGFNAHIQDITVSVNMSRGDLLEQGRKDPYFRFLNVPIEVATSITITPNAGESDDIDANPFADNLTNQTIKIVNNNGVVVDLGTKNKLQSITTNGGDTGGGNVTHTYNYTNFNTYRCTAPTTDPAGLV